MTQGENFSDLALEQQYDNMIKELGMEQETLEETAENYSKIFSLDGGHRSYAGQGFIDGAKWQTERMYSEEDVFDLMCKAFKAGYKKYEVVEAGLEGLETDVECNWILKKYGKNNLL